MHAAYELLRWGNFRMGGPRETCNLRLLQGMWREIENSTLLMILGRNLLLPSAAPHGSVVVRFLKLQRRRTRPLVNKTVIIHANTRASSQANQLEFSNNTTNPGLPAL